MTICEGLPTPTRQEILTKSKGMDGILWATHCELNAEALDAAGIHYEFGFKRFLITQSFTIHLQVLNFDQSQRNRQELISLMLLK